MWGFLPCFSTLHSVMIRSSSAGTIPSPSILTPWNVIPLARPLLSDAEKENSSHKTLSPFSQKSVNVFETPSVQPSVRTVVWSLYGGLWTSSVRSCRGLMSSSKPATKKERRRNRQHICLFERLSVEAARTDHC